MFWRAFLRIHAPAKIHSEDNGTRKERLLLKERKIRSESVTTLERIGVIWTELRPAACSDLEKIPMIP